MKIRRLNGFNDKFSVALLYAYYKLKREDRASVFGSLWLFIDPIVTFLIYFLFFFYIVKVEEENYPMLLLLGLTYWKFFVSGIQSGSGSIISSKPIVRNFDISPEFFPLMSVIYTSMKNIPSMIVFVVAACFMIPDVKFLSFLVIGGLLAYIILLNYMLSVYFSIACCFFPDTSKFLDLALRGGIFLSGVFFPLTNISEPWKSLLLSNPVALCIHEGRKYIYEGVLERPDWLLVGVSVVLFMSVLGTLFLKSFSGRIAARLVY